MNKVVLDHLMRKMHQGDERRRDYPDERDYREDRLGHWEARGEYRQDRRDYREDTRRDYEDGRDMQDYGNARDYHESSVFLSKSDMRKWDKMIENFDGSKGCHYAISEILPHAERCGVKFKEFSEKEFCMTVNMMYADYGKTVKKYAKSPEDELCMCIELARDFLEDPDGPEPSEKLALYFHCIVNGEV